MTELKVNAQLGKIAMYSLDTHSRIKVQDFRALASKYNIPQVLIPLPLSDQGAFQRATTWAAGAVVKAEEPVIVKEIENTNDKIVRTFERRMIDDVGSVEKIADGKTNVPVYRHIATMIYNKSRGTVDTWVQSSDGEQFVQRAMDRFNKTKFCYNIQQLRAFVQNVFQAYGAINLRHNGGVTFVPETYKEPFENFTKMCQELEGVDIVTLDVQFTKNNGNTIAQALQEHLSDSLENEIKTLKGKTTGTRALEDLVSDFSTALKARTIKEDCLNRMVFRFTETMKLVSTYRELLQINLDTTEEQIKIAKTQLKEMLATQERSA